MSPKLEISLDGVTVAASLQVDAAPKTVQALKEASPLTGISHHARWSGPAFNLVSKQERLRDLPPENVRHLLPPGTIVWISQNSEILVAYGDVRLCNGPAQELFGSVIGVVAEEDLERLAAKAHSLRFEGEKPISIRVL